MQAYRAPLWEQANFVLSALNTKTDLHFYSFSIFTLNSETSHEVIRESTN